jgi:hypothetical protein
MSAIPILSELNPHAHSTWTDNLSAYVAMEFASLSLALKGQLPDVISNRKPDSGKANIMAIDRDKVRSTVEDKTLLQVFTSKIDNLVEVKRNADIALLNQQTDINALRAKIYSQAEREALASTLYDKDTQQKVIISYFTDADSLMAKLETFSGASVKSTLESDEELAQYRRTSDLIAWLKKVKSLCYNSSGHSEVSFDAAKNALTETIMQGSEYDGYLKTFNEKVRICKSINANQISDLAFAEYFLVQLNHGYVTGSDTRLISKWRDGNENAWYHKSLLETQSKVSKYIEEVSKPSNAVKVSSRMQKNVKETKQTANQVMNKEAISKSDESLRVVNQQVADLKKLIQQSEMSLKRKDREIASKDKEIVKATNQIRNQNSHISNLKSHTTDQEGAALKSKKSRLTQGNLNKTSFGKNKNDKNDDALSEVSDAEFDFCPNTMSGKSCTKPGCKLNHSTTQWKKRLDEFQKA